MNLPKLPDFGPRTRKVLKIVGYVFLGLFSFVYALHLTFPYSRLKDKGVEALASKYDVTVQDVERGWLPGDFSLVNVKLATRPSKPGEVAKIIKIDRLDVDIGILSALGGGVDVDIDAKIGPGSLGGTISIEKGRVVLDLASHNLPLSDVPGLDSVLGMPASGPGHVVAKLDLPNNDWRKATGRIAVDCSGCTFGGPGAFFKPKNATSRTAAWAGEGVPVPRLMVSKLAAEWTIGKGKISTKKWTFDSPHLQAQLEWEATLEKDIKNARIDNACLRYRGTDALKQLDEKFYNALELTGGPLGPDDLRHLKLVGTLGNFKALGKECGGGGGGEDTVGGGDGGPRRPNLDAVPTGGAPPEGEPAGATTMGTIEAKPAAPMDAMPTGPEGVTPTPKIDDVRPGPPEGAAAGGAGGAVAPGQAEPGVVEPAPMPPEGAREPAPTDATGNPPPPPPYGTDSAHPAEPPPADFNQQPQQPPPPENE
jgi:type II secretion system protein N